MENKSVECRNYKTGMPSMSPHELIRATKWFGLIEGERCILCNRFFLDESYKIWKRK